MRFVDYQELSAIIGIPVPTLYSWVCKKQIPHIRISRRTVRFELEDVQEWLASRRVAVAGT